MEAMIEMRMRMIPRTKLVITRVLLMGNKVSHITKLNPPNSALMLGHTMKDSCLVAYQVRDKTILNVKN
jgi:hypothetical protein